MQLFTCSKYYLHIFYFVAADVFDLISKPKHASKGLVVSVSYFEIYSGKVSRCLIILIVWHTSL